MIDRKLGEYVGDARADLYALGTVAYEALAGRYAFDGKTMAAVMHAHVESFPHLPASFPEALDRVISRALSLRARVVHRRRAQAERDRRPLRRRDESGSRSPLEKMRATFASTARRREPTYIDVDTTTKPHLVLPDVKTPMPVPETAAAKMLGLPRPTLLKRLDAYGITRPRKK